jgi:hypothetical protein
MCRSAPRATLTFTVIVVAVTQGACLTAGVVQHATSPHPDLLYPTRITDAALAEDQLYLEIEAGSFPAGGGSRGRVSVRIDLAEIKRNLTGCVACKHDGEDRLKMLPVHLETETPTNSAQSVPVRERVFSTLEQLDSAAAGASGGLEVWMIRAGPGGEFAKYDGRHVRSDAYGEMVAIVFPSDGDEARVGLFQNYVQKPRGRRAWWLLTPFSVAGDVVLLPAYLVYALFGGC